MKHPWPTAPATPRVLGSEPSVLLADRTALANAAVEPRRNEVGSKAAHDSGNKSRYTLAVSIAVLLGTCWCLSNGFQPAERNHNAPSAFPVLPDSSASDPEALKERRKDQAIHGGAVRDNPPVTPKIQLP